MAEIVNVKYIRRKYRGIFISFLSGRRLSKTFYPLVDTRNEKRIRFKVYF